MKNDADRCCVIFLADLNLKTGFSTASTRKLAGGVAMAASKTVPFGIAIHADHAGARFQRVSFEYKLGIGTDGDVKAVKQ